MILTEIFVVYEFQRRPTDVSRQWFYKAYEDVTRNNPSQIISPIINVDVTGS